MDANGDTLRSTGEFGVPGVRIELVSSEGDVTRSTLTTDLGFFKFLDLPAGDYTITQQQPEALTDGSTTSSLPGVQLRDNEISNMVLDADDHATDIHFSETALKPDYVSIAWLFSSTWNGSDFGALLRDVVAGAEEQMGNVALAAQIREDAERGAITEPIAIDDVYAIAQGDTLSVDASSGLVANDVNPADDLLTAVLVDVPENGSITFNADGSFTYFPDQGFFGTDSFSYRAEGASGASNTARVVINVANVNSAPVAADDVYEVDEDQTLDVNASSGVLHNDNDADDDVLTAHLVSQPANGGITLNADGSFAYIPVADFHGTDSFTYAVSDGIVSSDPATVTITVHPVADTVPGSVTLTPSKDNSLFESADGSLSNGVGEYLFVGKTLQAENSLRRGLIAFDLSNVPAGAAITNVSLTMNMSRTIVGAFDVELRRALADWGEGNSDAPGQEGTGTISAPGDATWLHSFYDTQPWLARGGDFSADVSASTSVGVNGTYTWTSPQMTSDVQDWLDSPESNFGWFLITDETETTAKRFDSREHSTPEKRPQLVVDYLFTPESPAASKVEQPAAPSARYAEAADSVYHNYRPEDIHVRRQTRFV